MDLVDEQHLTRGELAQHRYKIGGALNYRARCRMEVDAHFAGDDLCERRLAEPGRTEEQDMVERLATTLRRFDKDAQIVAQLLLADKFVEGSRPDRTFRCILLDLLRGDDARYGVAHRASSSRPALISTSAPASLPSRRAAAAIAPSASARPTPRCSSAAIASAAAPSPFIGLLSSAPDDADTGAARLPILSRNSLTMRAAS